MGFSLALIWSTNPSYLTSQLIFFVIGLFIYIFISQLDSSLIKGFAVPFYILSIALLLITLLSFEIRGASRWIDIFGVRMQPSELVKPLMIVSFAYLMSEFKVKSIADFIKLFCLYTLPIAIIFFQPDLGNVIVFSIFLGGMIFANNLNSKIIILSIGLAVLISPTLWHILKGYQKQRILTYISPQSDPSGAGYNAIQAMIAVGSGGLFGMGLGRGTQSHLRFLPENHTDFIFASLTEELGFLGAGLLLLFYSLIFRKLLHIARKTEDKFSYLIVLGIFTQIFSQVFINIAMNIGLVPITGVTLPLVSAGGSSIIATFLALGIVSSLEKDYKDDPLVIK